MQFEKGNRFWEARSRHGRNPIFDAPEKLAEACLDYFVWCEANPLWEEKVGFTAGKGVVQTVAKMRAMTIGGLCIFLDITPQVWGNWRRERPDFLSVISTAEEIIKNQKFSGAAAGLLNANIIARDLGLRDTTGLQNLNDKGDPTNPPGSGIDVFMAASSAALARIRNGEKSDE